MTDSSKSGIKSCKPLSLSLSLTFSTAVLAQPIIVFTMAVHRRQKEGLKAYKTSQLKALDMNGILAAGQARH